MAVEPVVYGASERPPRGDYSRAGADYTCPQDYAGYTQADHDTYRRLYERQAALVPGLACDEFIAALPSLGVKEQIPRFDEINDRLHKATRWEIVAVPGLIPEVAVLHAAGEPQIPGHRLDPHSPRSSTTSSSPTSSTTCSATCRCCSIRSSPTTCRSTARAA